MLLESIPPALALRGWALLPPTWTDWIRTLTSLPTAVLPPTCGLLPGTWNHVFTDGSCLHSSEPMYRLASWAAVLAPPCDRCWTPGRASVLCASVLPGVCQTAYRAELFAIAYVLHWAAAFQAPVKIWTDCRSVVLRFYNYFWGHRRISVNRPNSDLWRWIADSVATLGKERSVCRRFQHTGTFRMHAVCKKLGSVFTTITLTGLPGWPIRHDLLVFGVNGRLM